MAKKKKVRKPRDIRIFLNSELVYLKPQFVGLKETKRVRDKLNQHIEYLEQEGK